jgi:4-carboxymuconolactone decarboxylase
MIEGSVKKKKRKLPVILQMTFYSGGAAVSNALSIAKEVFQNHVK